MQKKYTIYDIAKLSGFSPKTVARVVNNEGNVAKGTEEKIRAVIDELGYTPNTYAKNLKSKKDKTVLLSIRTTNGFPLQWMQMIIEQVGIICLEKGITVLVEYFYDEESLGKSMISRSVNYLDGVIIFYEQENDVRIKELRAKNIPFVVFERAYDSAVRYVCNNNYQILYSIFDALCRKGLSKAELMLRSDTLVNRDRVNGVVDAFMNNGIDVGNVKITYGIGNAESAYEHIIEEYGAGMLREVYFISGDERAIGVYKAFDELGIRIGKDVSVIGFDDIPLSSYISPGLSTVRPSYHDLAENLVLMLVPENGNGNDHVVVPASFIKRESIQEKYL